MRHRKFIILLLAAGALALLGWIGAGALGFLPELPSLESPPPGFRRQQLRAAPGFFARILHPAPLTLAFGPPEGEHTRFRIRDAQTGERAIEICRAAGRHGAWEELAALPANGDDLILSRQGQHLRIYTDGRLLREWSGLSGDELPLLADLPEGGTEFLLQKTDPVEWSDDFMRIEIGTADAWTPLGGVWRTLHDSQYQASPNPFLCSASASADASGMLLTGYPLWNNLVFSAALQLNPDSEAGLVFAFQGPEDYWRAVLRPSPGGGELALVQVRGGTEEVVASRSVHLPEGRWTALAVRLFEGEPLTVLADETPLLTGPADAALFGKAGLWAGRNSCLFDMVSASTAEGKPDRLRPVEKRSQLYTAKPRYEKDDRDDQLDRWAKDYDAWLPVRREEAGSPYWGKRFHLPLFSDFRLECDGAGGTESLLFGAKGWSGEPVFTAAAGDPGTAVLARQSGVLSLNDAPLGSLPEGGGAYIAVLTRNVDQYRSLAPRLFARHVRQELFENGPVRWLPIDGFWQNSARWACQRQWAFFSGFGYDSSVLVSKERFDGDQCHEFYYGLMDIFHREYRTRRYARHDVNFSLCTDGRDLWSGYTFLYGGRRNTASLLFRRRELVAKNTEIRFPLKDATEDGRMADIMDQHTFWRRFRFEREGARLRVLFDDQEHQQEVVVFDYTDPEPAAMPTGGHIALWTYRNGVMYARLNSSAASIRPEGAAYLLREGDESTLPWQALQPNRVLLRAEGDLTVVENPFSGGIFAVRYPLPRPVDLSSSPRLRLRCEIPEGVKVSLHLRIAGKDLILPLTAPTAETFRVLGPPLPGLQGGVYPWALLAAEPLRPPVLDGTPAPSVSGTVELDLLAAWKRLVPEGSVNTDAPMLTDLIIGNTSHADYLMTGFSGNAAGSAYRVGRPEFH